MFPELFWELILMVVLLIMGSSTYTVATKNRGSFADTPDWSKVMRRIIEFASVTLLLLFVIFQGWHFSGVSKALLIAMPIVGILVGSSSMILLHAEKHADSHTESEETEGVPSPKQVLTNRLTEHLINAIILILFFLSALIIMIMTVAKMYEYQYLIDYCTVLTVVFLSLELAMMLHHILRLIYIDNLPNKEIGQVLKIFKSLDD